MTITTFSPPNFNSSTLYYWDSAINWSPRVVPNSATAVVQLPVEGQLPSYYSVEIVTGESFEASAATVTAGELVDTGSLTILNEFVIGTNGSFATFDTGGSGILTAGSMENDGNIITIGQLVITGELVNRGDLAGGSLTISAEQFDNAGTLRAAYGGNLTLSIGAGGFVNLSNGTLTGGSYEADAGEILSINVNGPITTLAASVTIGGAFNGSAAGILQTYGATGTTQVSLLSSLTAIAPSGLLDVEGAGPVTLSQAVTDQGTILVASATLNAPGLTVSSGGTLVTSGNVTLSLSGTLVDNGIILADLQGLKEQSAAVVIGGPVSGSGSIVIGVGSALPGAPEYVPLPVTVELGSADSAAVLFADRVGILQLDAPQSFTGSIEGFTSGDQIVLSDISLQSVINASYSGDSTHGVLTLQEAGGASLALAFQGNYSTSNFTLAAGTQTGSVVISDSATSSQAAVTVAAAISAYKAGSLSAGTTVTDSVADVAANLDMLQTMKAAGTLGQIVLSDGYIIYANGQDRPPVISVTTTQLAKDAAALQDIAGAYTLDVTGATAFQAENLAGGGHVGWIDVTDSIGDLVSQIDQLGTLASTGQVSSISITDTSFASISVTAAQFSADRAAFTEMTGDYTVTVSAPAASATIEGLKGHSVTVVFSGAASQYSLAAQGDGIGLTVSGLGATDSLREVTAVKFSDVTDIVAQTPGSNGIVTTGNVAELYGAVFGRTPDVAGLAFYQGVLTANPGTSLTTLAQYFLASPEYTGNSADIYAQSAAGDSQFITDAYQNLLHRAPEDGAIPFYLKVIDAFTDGLTAGTSAYAAAQTLGHAYVLTYFSQSPEFLTDVQVTASAPSSAQHWLVLI